jgi:hypothetical protein
VSKRIDVHPGDRYGRLIVVEEVEGRGHSRCFLLSCDCGQSKQADLDNLRRQLTTSCGCHMREVNTKHGMIHHPGYHSWKNMISRTTPGGSAQRNRPGYVGVGRHPAWSSFDAFWLNMGPTWFHGAVLGRYGDVGDYTPTNCRWITKSENAKERGRRTPARLYGVQP